VSCFAVWPGPGVTANEEDDDEDGWRYLGVPVFSRLPRDRAAAHASLYRWVGSWLASWVARWLGLRAFDDDADLPSSRELCPGIGILTFAFTLSTPTLLVYWSSSDVRPSLGPLLPSARTARARFSTRFTGSLPPSQSGDAAYPSA